MRLPRIVTPSRVFFIVNGIAVELHENRGTYMATTITVGHSLDMAIGYLDQNGNPMLTTVTPDAPPAWTNLQPGVFKLTPSADGLTCTGDGLAAGTDTVSLAAAVGGKGYSATLAVEVDAAPQVLTSIVINVPQVTPTVTPTA
jgi:hypothetical protein